MEAELLDWELVHGSDTDPIASEKNSGSSSDGMILSHHFLPFGFDQLDACVRNETGFSAENHDAVADDESHVEECTDHLQAEDPSNSCSDSGGKQLVSRDSGIVIGEEKIASDSEAVKESGGDSVVVRCGDDSKSRETVWWKMPFVLVKYCAFRIGPVWSVSMAAALMGFLLLGRRLYNTKNKPQRIHFKVPIDYKKMSQVMSQAARLNEAFTEVRRVPVIRPALPAPGAWHVLSLR